MAGGFLELPSGSGLFCRSGPFELDLEHPHTRLSLLVLSMFLLKGLVGKDLPMSGGHGSLAVCHNTLASREAHWTCHMLNEEVFSLKCFVRSQTK